MNFTREPLIETVISCKDGYKLALRSSKGNSQEEFFVNAVEVISFGNSSFYRSLEKPKSFLVPISDYEILEVREARMVLKTTGVESGIKIAGGRDTAIKPSKEDKVEILSIQDEEEQKAEKQKERRRTRKRRTKTETQGQTRAVAEHEGQDIEKVALIPPPSTLISETISRYKEAIPLKSAEDDGDEADKNTLPSL